MRSSYRLFRVFGIWVELHVTFLAFLILLLLSPKWLTFILLAFMFVLLHELGHSLVAKRGGVPVERIILTPIGGIASVDIPQKPRLEFVVSATGPIVNFVLAALAFTALASMGVPLEPYTQVLDETGVIPTLPQFLQLTLYLNVMLGVFNLVPGFPMDGGRLVRSALAFRLDYLKATRMAVGVGRNFVFPVMFIYGLLTGHIILMIMAFLLHTASGNELRVITLKSVFRGVTVGEVCVGKPTHVRADSTLKEFIDSKLNPRERFYVVADEDGRVLGLLDVKELEDAGARSQNRKVAGLASGEFAVISANTKVNDKLARLIFEEYILVVDEKRVVGYVTPQLLSARAAYMRLARRR